LAAATDCRVRGKREPVAKHPSGLRMDGECKGALKRVNTKTCKIITKVKRNRRGTGANRNTENRIGGDEKVKLSDKI